MRGTVKGLGGKRVSATGSGKLTLTDRNGNKYTIPDVAYVPDSSAPILSMFKLRKIGLDLGFLGDNDEGDFIVSAKNSDFQMIGNAVDDILYVSEGTTNTALVTTRSNKRNAEKVENPPASSNLLEMPNESCHATESHEYMTFPISVVLSNLPVIALRRQSWGSTKLN
jgi:hypothetical protein